jgi:predicted nucleotidyltransferase component of viral defense system
MTAVGNPETSVWGALSLAIRNTVKPSRVLRMTYSVPSVIEQGVGLEIVVEANVTERQPHRAIVQIPFEFSFREAPLRTKINGYDIHEMLGTKLRALFQRKRGRDLFDLYWALTKSKPAVDPAAVFKSFQYYLRQEGTTAGRAEFTKLLESHLADRGFCSDMQPLLRAGVIYDPKKAGDYVKERLLNLLPEGKP